MSDVFGFDEAIQDLERYSSRANNINEKVYQEGIKMRDDARNIARGLGLYKTVKVSVVLILKEFLMVLRLVGQIDLIFICFFMSLAFMLLGVKKVKDVLHDQVMVNESVGIRQVQYTCHLNHI